MTDLFLFLSISENNCIFFIIVIIVIIIYFMYLVVCAALLFLDPENQKLTKNILEILR